MSETTQGRNTYMLVRMENAWALKQRKLKENIIGYWPRLHHALARTRKVVSTTTSGAHQASLSNRS